MSEIDRLPAHVIREVKKRLGRRKSEWRIVEPNDEWLKSGRLLMVRGKSTSRLVLFADGDSYYILNGADSIGIINRVLGDYRFPAAHFHEVGWLVGFFELVVDLFSESGGEIASSALLNVVDSPESGLTPWLRRRGENEQEFRAMFYDPKVRFADGEWTATFNLLTPEGGVDEWHITGTHEEMTQTNRICAIERRTLKRKGSYYYMIEGGSRSGR